MAHARALPFTTVPTLHRPPCREHPSTVISPIVISPMTSTSPYPNAAPTRHVPAQQCRPTPGWPTVTARSIYQRPPSPTAATEPQRPTRLVPASWTRQHLGFRTISGPRANALPPYFHPGVASDRSPALFPTNDVARDSRDSSAFLFDEYRCNDFICVVLYLHTFNLCERYGETSANGYRFPGTHSQSFLDLQAPC